MAQQGLFVYKGRSGSADGVYQSGECAMYTGTSAAYGGIKRNLKAESGISTLPYYPDVPGAPQNTVIGGASLWAMAGKKPDEYKGVALFYKYLSEPEVQAKSHQQTGYLPITTEAFNLTEKSGFYKANPGTDVSVTQMIRKTTDKSRGIRLGNFVQIRTILDEELEQVWSERRRPRKGWRTRRSAATPAGEVRESQQGLMPLLAFGRVGAPLPRPLPAGRGEV